MIRVQLLSCTNGPYPTGTTASEASMIGSSPRSMVRGESPTSSRTSSFKLDKRGDADSTSLSSNTVWCSGADYAGVGPRDNQGHLAALRK